MSNGTNSSQLINCTFSNNAADDYGGGIYASAILTNSPQLTNCTFSNNTADDYGGGIYAFASGTNSSQLTNCILWGNNAAQGLDIWMNKSDGAKISHSIVSAGGVHVESNIGTVTYVDTLNQDPMLVDAMNNDLRLLPGSPAINAGINDSIPDGVTTDIAGLDRINCDIVDMGAHEAQEELIITCSGPVTVDTDAGMCSTAFSNMNLIAPTANCNITATNNAPASFSVGSNTFKWFVVDTDGRKDTCEQTVIVIDNEKPTITCPAPVTVNTDIESCMATAVILGNPTFNDNCGVALVGPDIIIFPVGETTVTWTATDVNGLKGTCTQIVTVEDNEDPMITCPSDTTITSGTNVILNDPITSDNCTGSLSVSNDAPAVFVDAVTTVTWTVTDAAMNQNTCAQIVTLDTTDPCEEDITIDQSPNGKASYSTNQNIFLDVQAAQSDTLLLSFGISTQALPAFEIAKGGVLEIVNTGCIED